MPTPPESSLLCETCGYALDGFDPDAPCPECGTPVRESLPSARPGTPWQLRPSVLAWMRTCWAVLRHPQQTLRSLRVVDNRNTRLLLFINISLAALLAGVMWISVANSMRGGGMSAWYMRPTGNGMGQFVPYAALNIPSSIPFAVGCIPALAGALVVLTWIEELGVRYFGNRRGWRVTRPVARAVCAHASIGWVVGGILHALTPLARTPMWALLDRLPPRAAIEVATYFLLAWPFFSFFIGMLIFETLVYLGIRQCRYANAPPSASP